MTPKSNGEEAEPEADAERWDGDLPRGFFKMEVIKGRADPSVHKRKLPDIDELRRKIEAGEQ